MDEGQEHMMKHLRQAWGIAYKTKMQIVQKPFIIYTRTGTQNWQFIFTIFLWQH